MADDFRPRLYAAVNDGDVPVIRDLVTRHRDELKEDDLLNYYLRMAASANQIEVMSELVQMGADINAPQIDGRPEGPVDDAVMDGAIAAARWLLQRGARLNHEVKGVTRCQSLVTAVHKGNLEMVKLLVEHGADINACWAGLTPLSWAINHGQSEVENYLRSKGALEPSHLKSEKPAASKASTKEAKKKGK